VIGYASASSGYAIGFEGEAALVARLARRTGVAVAATCASAVLALRVLGVERMALVGPLPPGRDRAGSGRRCCPSRPRPVPLRRPQTAESWGGPVPRPRLVRVAGIP